MAQKHHSLRTTHCSPLREMREHRRDQRLAFLILQLVERVERLDRVARVHFIGDGVDPPSPFGLRRARRRGRGRESQVERGRPQVIQSPRKD